MIFNGWSHSGARSSIGARLAPRLDAWQSSLRQGPGAPLDPWLRPSAVFPPAMSLKRMIPLILLLTGAPISAQTARASAPESHQFDFWLGEWDVFDTQGKAGGHSRIDSIAEGRGLLENWTDAGGTTGKSLNVYNDAKRCWQQFWVGDGTPVLELSGGLVGESMVLSGSRAGKSGAPTVDRITWTPLADGAVRQHWELSSDGGKTWRDIFIGIYRHPAAH